MPRSSCPGNSTTFMDTTDCLVIHPSCIWRASCIHSNNGCVSSSPNCLSNGLSSLETGQRRTISVRPALLNTQVLLSLIVVSSAGHTLSTFPYPATLHQPDHAGNDTLTTLLSRHSICVKSPRPRRHSDPSSQSLSRRVNHAWRGPANHATPLAPLLPRYL